MGDVGARFAKALAAKDAAGLKDVLRPGVDFRAMTPSRFWESADVDDIVDGTILGTWFAPDREILSVLGVDEDHDSPVDRVAYRLRVRLPDGEYLVEQQAYYETVDDRISWLRIMCTGFVPAPSQS